jgi:hypothetical protein
MNDKTEQGFQAPAVYDDSMTSTAILIMDKNAMASMMEMAELMASSKVTIPQHLRGNKGDCMAVVMQAVQWKMNPFAIAQKTHLSQSGALGYEAQLINTVIVTTGAVRGQPEFEFIGDWGKILGKVEERKSDKGGKYYVAGWSKGDEEGLGVIVTATLRGESAPRTITVMLSQCYPRFSTQWATDPQQQITYVGVRKFSRRYAPGAILGVYTPEELDTPPTEIEINPTDFKSNGKPPIDQPPAFYPDDKFKSNLPTWAKMIAEGKKTAADIIKTVQSKNPLTDDQKAEIMAVKALASKEQMDDIATKAEAAGITWDEVCRGIGIEPDEVMEAEQVARALAFINNPMGE